MKKLVVFMIIALTMQLNNVLAQDIIIEPIKNENYYPFIFDETNTPPEITEINGEMYLWNSLKDGRHPIKHDPLNYNFFQPEYDYIFTGEYYLKRFAGGDYTSGLDKMRNMLLSVYDKQFNLVDTHKFDRYINSIGYCNGTYYCQEVYNNYWISKDLKNWTKAESGIIFADDFGNSTIQIVRPSAEDNKIEYQVSFNESKFYTIEYESETLLSNIRYFGKWIFNKNPQSIHLSNDGVYSTNILATLDYEYSNEYLKPNGSDEVIMYEYENQLIIEWLRPVFSFNQAFSEVKGYRFRISKQPLYEELNELQSAPYVCYDNKILAFEQPPVIENDYTLVPIRFLFEQMGADVTWNQETQTATITQDNTAITFGIDDTNASVNGSNVSMDIPARLINGKTMVPVRFLSEELGYTVDWDGENRIITIE